MIKAICVTWRILAGLGNYGSYILRWSGRGTSGCSIRSRFAWRRPRRFEAAQSGQSVPCRYSPLPCPWVQGLHVQKPYIFWSTTKKPTIHKDPDKKFAFWGLQVRFGVAMPFDLELLTPTAAAKRAALVFPRRNGFRV